jgi:hypothetical protein
MTGQDKKFMARAIELSEKTSLVDSAGGVFGTVIVQNGKIIGDHLPPPPKPITEKRIITVTSTQIQYSQTVLLNFGPLSWPHVSVATLTPKHPLNLPPSVWV